MKRFLLILLVIALLFILYFGGMIGYAIWTDYDPEVPEEVLVEKNPAQALDTDTLDMIIWNIGFAGLGQESDFFYDGGEKVKMPKEVVKKNLEGILDWMGQQASGTDFFLLQEVDRNSDRSTHVNQVDRISEMLPGFGHAFGTNYKVGFIPIPLTNPLGKVNSGVATWSKYHIASATRYPFKGNYNWPTYLFFLDRCYLLFRYQTADDKEIILINTHNSAYDDGSLKETQMKQLKEVILAEYEKGNYVIVGGDWNQYPPDFAGFPNFPKPRTPQNDNLFVSEKYPASGWHWAYDNSSPSNRSLAAAFDTDTTNRSVLDFYLVSPNVEVLTVEGVDLGFEFSDHNPVRASFRLIREEEEPEI